MEILFVIGVIVVSVGVSVIVWFVGNSVLGGYFYGKFVLWVEMLIGVDGEDY